MKPTRCFCFRNFVLVCASFLALEALADTSEQIFYDAFGRPVAKRITVNGQTFTQSYLYLADTNQILQAKKGDGTIVTYLDGNNENEHLGQVENGVAKAYVTDHLGSVLNGDPAGPWHSFGLFGEVNANVQISPTSDPVMYGWQGLQYDAAMGQWNNRARMYHQNIGTFTSQDPSGIDGGLNLYGSRLNNPLKYLDPTGNGPILAGLCVLGATGTIVAGGVAHVGEAAERRLAYETEVSKIDEQLSSDSCPNPNELKQKKEALQRQYKIAVGLQATEGLLQAGLLGGIATYCALPLIAPTP